MADVRTSSFCAGGSCVQVEFTDNGVTLTDPNDRYTQVAYSSDEWRAFLAGARAGEFDLPADRSAVPPP